LLAEIFVLILVKLCVPGITLYTTPAYGSYTKKTTSTVNAISLKLLCYEHYFIQLLSPLQKMAAISQC